MSGISEPNDGTVVPFAELTGRRALVTGSSSGIGRAIALEFGRAGADVLVHAHANGGGAEETAAAIRRLGRASKVVLADVGTEFGREAIVAAGYADGPDVDIWVNNAGVDLLTGGANALPYDEKLARLLDIDVRGTILLSKAVGRRMQEGNGGVILNVGWDQADRGMGGDSGELFAASKNAIMGFTRSLAVSLAPRVRVNCIAPGWIRTAWGKTASDHWQDRVRRETPLDRWGTPEDIANTARFLCSDAAAFVTGQVVSVNGGAVR